MYQLSCSGCCSSYIGKTDRCLYTRIKEHAKSDKSEIFNHVHNCEEFPCIRTLLNYPTNLLDCNCSTSLVDLIYSNCKVIDRSNDWSLLLFKEAFHIHRLNPELNHGARASKELTIFGANSMAADIRKSMVVRFKSRRYSEARTVPWRHIRCTFDSRQKNYGGCLNFDMHVHAD